MAGKADANPLISSGPSSICANLVLARRSPRRRRESCDQNGRGQATKPSGPANRSTASDEASMQASRTASAVVAIPNFDLAAAKRRAHVRRETCKETAASPAVAPVAISCRRRCSSDSRSSVASSACGRRSPPSPATAAACSLVRAPSRSLAPRMCVSTVAGLILSRAAIPLVVRPHATSSTTARCVGVSARLARSV
jgi:hypothetical protein